MNRWSDLIILFIVSALVLLFTAPAPAAEKKDSDPSQKDPHNYVRAKKSAAIWLEGAANLRFVFRDDELSAQIRGFRKGTGDSTTYVDPDLEIGIEVKATRQIYGHIKIRTPMYARDYIGTAPRDLDGDGEPDVSNRPLEVDEIYAELREFPHATSRFRMGMTLGLKNIAYSLEKDKEKGRSFFINVGQSENPFAGAYPNTSSPGNRTLELAGGETTRGTTEFGGVILRMNTLVKRKKRGGIEIDIGYGTLQETMEADDDRELMWVWLTKDWLERGRAHAFIVGLTNNPTSRIWTFGGGATYKMSNLVIFGEAAFQIGTFLEHNVNQYGLVGPGNREEIKQLAAGGYLGLRYTYKTKPPKGVSPSQVGWKPFFEVKYWGLTGDSDQNNRRQQNFISLEDWDEFIVAESDEYGFDIDTNVEAYKFAAGFQPYKNMEFIFQYGHFLRADDKTAGDKIGDEIDLKLSWEPDESLRFEVGVGTLYNSVFLQNMKAMTAAYMSVSVKF
ncbi:MAG: hypothetical protein E3J72_10985 [Planctomycetota bacterium]|nr:MAG: hypothetical protein E3J72_10985 [Planctomycetota bacterium]